jgi:nicotinate phosphoribosyltransferase
LRPLSEIYKENLSLLTDFYQITMAYSAWKTGQADKEAVFDLYFRNNPFKGGYAVHGGLASVLDFIEHFHIDHQQCEYLASLKGGDGQPLFDSKFIEFLSKMKLTVDVEAIAEGRVIFAGEPLYRIRGPVLQCQLLETPLLNMVNFETLIATKASRVREVAGKDPVLEFGLRRAQGIDGGICASRAAYIGGADATSNVMAGKLFGIPLKGTHAHSWVMSFADELEAFQKFAEAMPNNCILLVDTYNTLEGVKKAAQVGLELKAKGHKLQGIRLDSGDLAYLSIEARKILDSAGLTDTKILASNDLDENIIQSLKMQGARIDIWAVGTKLVTAYDQPALGGVYKLVAVKNKNGEYEDRVKISEQSAKTTNPGIHQVRRFTADGLFVGDMIYDLRSPPKGELLMIDPLDPTRRKVFDGKETFEDLLIPVIKNGKPVYKSPALDEIRKVRESEVAKLHPTTRRFTFPHIYPVGLEASLYAHKNELILAHRGFSNGGM